MGRKTFRKLVPVFCLLLAFEAEGGVFGGISRKEFFDRLEEFLRSVRTFQADVLQESRFPDGIVQRYSGKLYVREDGRIAYDYDLVFEGEDPSLIPDVPSGTQENPREERLRNRAPSGVYLTKGPTVIHYDNQQNLLVEAPEDENLLIQLFKALVGQGRFDVKKFRDEHKILKISEKTVDGEPVYVMVARPKKNSDLYRAWSSRLKNRMLNWRQELWVKQSTMEPVRAALHSSNESTIVRLNNVRINEPVNPDVFLIHPEGGSRPLKIRRGDVFHKPNRPARGPAVEKPLEEIPLEGE